VNFLAHLWLADRSDTSLAGSVLGDVVRGADLSAYPADIALGVRLHRRVDAATDRHELMRRERAHFADGERRYAGIVLDLVADHALARAWRDFHPEPLRSFADRCAAAMADAGQWFELGGGRRPTRTGFAELLESYGTDPGLERALHRTATRMRDPQGLIGAGRRWKEASQSLDENLPALLHDLLRIMRSP
jgi:acyl carrier protein phosphodiesterase